MLNPLEIANGRAANLYALALPAKSIGARWS